LLAQSLHQTNLAVIGGVVATFFGVASVTAVITRAVGSRSAVVSTFVLLLLGLGLLVLAEVRHSMVLLVGAAIIGGAATALGYCGSLRIINQIAPAEQRAEVVSSYLLVCYSANSIPVIGVGLLSPAVGASIAHRVFAIVIAAAALIACTTGLRYAPRTKPTEPGA
jgi:MFS family permease